MILLSIAVIAQCTDFLIMTDDSQPTDEELMEMARGLLHVSDIVERLEAGHMAAPFIFDDDTTVLSDDAWQKLLSRDRLSNQQRSDNA